MRMWTLSLCMALVSLGAQAQEAPPPANTPAPATTVREACRTDLQKFCQNVQPGGGRIRECMASHKDDLSQGCRDALASARSHRANTQTQ
jgi:hypothetical protein